MPMTNGLQLLTQSRWREFKTCVRKHYYAYELGIDTPSTSEALIFGTVTHELLELLWNGEIRKFEDGWPTDLSLESAWKLRALVDTYSLFWDRNDYETIATELEFNLPLLNPDTGHSSRTYRLAGKIDAIAKDEKGDYYIIEHKTSGMDISAGSAYWQRLFLDEQVGIYLHAARRLGYPVVGCIYDVLRKPSIKLKFETPDEKKKYTKGKDGKLRLHKGQRDSDESGEDYYTRVMHELSVNPTKYLVRAQVVRTSTDEDNLLRDLWFQAKQMTLYRHESLHPTNSQSCFKFNRACKFFDLCCNTSDLTNDRWIKKDRIHTELEGVTNDQIKELKIVTAKESA